MSFDVFQEYVSRYHYRLYNIYRDIDMVRPQEPSDKSIPDRKSDVPDHHVDRLHYYVL